MPRARSLHPSTKVTQSLSKTNSRSKSGLVTPPTPTPVKRGRGRPPKIPKVTSADLPKVPTPESSDGEYQPEDEIIAVMPVIRSRPSRSTSTRPTQRVKEVISRSASSRASTQARVKKNIKSIYGPVANVSAHSPTEASSPEAQKLWTAFVSRLRDVHRRQPDWTKVSVGVKKDLGEILVEVMIAMDHS